MRNFSWKCEKNARWRHKNITKSWDFPHNIIILRFCNIVEGQAIYIKFQSLLLHNLFHTLLRLKEIFPFVGDEKNHSNAYQFKNAGKQGAMQLAALAVTLVIAIVGGTITGFILKGFF